MERHVPWMTAQISVGSSRLRLLANINQALFYAKITIYVHEYTM